MTRRCSVGINWQHKREGLVEFAICTLLLTEESNYKRNIYGLLIVLMYRTVFPLNLPVITAGLRQPW